MAHHTDDLGPVAGHARRLRGEDLLVQAAAAREAGGEEGGAGVDIAASGRRLWGGELPFSPLPFGGEGWERGTYSGPSRLRLGSTPNGRALVRDRVIEHG